MRRNTFLFSVIILLGLTRCGNSNQKDFKSWAPTPPMGWNSWDCYGPTVKEHEVKANADYMAEKLKDYGWEYVVIDIRWFVENTKAGGYNKMNPRYVLDEYGRYIPAVNRFPSAKDGQGFKALADYIHQKGLKFGIHIMRGVPVQAVEKKLPIKGTNDITADQIYTTDLQCHWLRDNYTIVADKPGAQEYYNSIFDLYAQWGVDFVKIDDLSKPYHKGEIELIRKAIDQCGRPMVLSTSPGETPIEEATHIREHANMWRLVGDVWDTWADVEHLFEVSQKWYPHIAPGTWPDCDMIPLGRLSIRGERGEDRMSLLTKDEQYSLMTLWTIFRSPLMFGGDLPSNDDFTLSLLTNNEVLDITKYSTNNRLLLDEGDQKIWVAEDTRSDDVYAAIFSVVEQPPIDPAKAKFNSNLLTHKLGEQSTDMKVDIGNAKKLYLVVTDGGDGSSWDMANWIAPQLVGTKDTLSLTEMGWVKASAGWGNPRIDKNVAGGNLVINDISYENGIGTHSTSIIEYDIPEGYDTFQAKAGLDKACVVHPDGATVRYHVFTESPFEFNLPELQEGSLDFEKLGLSGKYTVRDLWARKDMGEYSDSLTLQVKNHGARLVRISKVNR